MRWEWRERGSRTRFRRGRQVMAPGTCAGVVVTWTIGQFAHERDGVWLRAASSGADLDLALRFMRRGLEQRLAVVLGRRLRDQANGGQGGRPSLQLIEDDREP